MKYILKPKIDDDHLTNYVMGRDGQAWDDFAGNPHIVTPTTVGPLEASSHKANGDQFDGTGNSTAHFLHLFDHTSGIEFGLENHERTGNYEIPTLDSHGVWNVTMPKGIQDGTHGEQGINVNRSAAVVDLSMNFGAGKPTDGQFVLTVNGHDFSLKHTGTGAAEQFYFGDSNGFNPLALTKSPDGHVLQDSLDLAFVASLLQHNANPADLKAQDVHIALTEYIHSGQMELVGVAQVSETIHLV